MREGTLGGNPVTAEVDPWFLFNLALGGNEKSADFWARLEDTRYCLVALTDTIKYKIFKELNKQSVHCHKLVRNQSSLKSRNRLNLEQADEFKCLTALLPRLVGTIERAEQTKKADQAKKDRLVEEAEKFPMGGKKAEPKIGEKEDKVPSLRRRNSDASSDYTVYEHEPVPENIDVYVREPRAEKIKVYDDFNSVYSYDSMDERYVNSSFFST